MMVMMIAAKMTEALLRAEVDSCQQVKDLAPTYERLCQEYTNFTALILLLCEERFEWLMADYCDL
jgi:hypothetical protein